MCAPLPSSSSSSFGARRRRSCCCWGVRQAPDRGLHASLLAKAIEGAHGCSFGLLVWSLLLGAALSSVLSALSLARSRDEDSWSWSVFFLVCSCRIVSGRFTENPWGEGGHLTGTNVTCDKTKNVAAKVTAKKGRKRVKTVHELASVCVCLYVKSCVTRLKSGLTLNERKKKYKEN